MDRDDAKSFLLTSRSDNFGIDILEERPIFENADFFGALFL